jgi:peptidoglycan hydrolase-like protein with peptidoglycan-binding domain
MASMCFQNGLYWNTIHVNTWALMKEHKWEEAAIECANSAWARETPSRVPGFQAALRSQIAATDSDQAKPNAASEGKLHKHTLAPKAKAQKIAAAQEAQAHKPDTLPKGKEGMKQVQTKLQALGLYSGKIDGIAKSSKGESNTVKGIKQFQQSHGLPVTGEVDGLTWERLSVAKPGDGQSVWERFMAKQEAEAKGQKTNKDNGGLAAPFRKMVAEANAKGKESAGSEASETGNFVDKKYWRTQESADEGGQAGFISPHASPTACRYVSSEMLILYMKAEKPEMLEELGVSGIGDLAFGAKIDVTDNTINAGGFLRIVQEDASKQTDGYTKNVQNPDAMAVHDQASDAIAYIDEKLNAGIPLVVGVDHTFNRGRNEGTTDHFVTLTGIGVTEDGKKFYHFFDPARASQVNGVDNGGKNRLVEESKGMYRAPEPTGSGNAQRYYLTTVIVFPADRKKFKEE